MRNVALEGSSGVSVLESSHRVLVLLVFLNSAMMVRIVPLQQQLRNIVARMMKSLVWRSEASLGTKSKIIIIVIIAVIILISIIVIGVGVR